MAKFRNCKRRKRKFTISKRTPKVELRFWITKFVITKRKIGALHHPAPPV